MNCIEKRAEMLIKSVEFSWREFPKRRPVAASESERKREEKILNRRFGKTAVAAVAAGALLLFVGAPLMQADDDRAERCQRAIEKAEVRLDKAIQKHGEHSHEAQERRRDVNAERDRCWNERHQWWNAREHRWETERNWEQDQRYDNDHH
jgi:hypothetical protein